MFAGGDPETGKRYLEQQGFEAQRHGEGFNYSVRKPGEQEWRQFDPAGFDWEDLTDISGDVLSLAGMTIGAGAGAGGGLLGLAAGGAAGAAGAQAIRGGLGEEFGLRPTAGETVGAVSEEALIGGMFGPLGAPGKALRPAISALEKGAGKYVQMMRPGVWEPATAFEVAKGMFRGSGKFAKYGGPGRLEAITKSELIAPAAVGAVRAGGERVRKALTPRGPGTKFVEETILKGGPSRAAAAAPELTAAQGRRALEQVRKGVHPSMETAIAAIQKAGAPAAAAAGKAAPSGMLGGLARAAGGAALGGMFGGTAGGLVGGGIGFLGRAGLRKISSRLMGDSTGQSIKALLGRATGSVRQKLGKILETLQTRGEMAYRAAVWSALQQRDVQRFLHAQAGVKTGAGETRGRRPTLP